MQNMLFSFLLLLGLNAFAQKDSTPIPPFLKTREIPGFKILQMDSATYFYKYQLKKNTPTVIVYFSPDCEHCQVDAKDLIDSIKYVKNIQFVYAAYSPFVAIKKFDSTYKMSAQPNIKIGRDEKYFIPSFYKVRFTPFVAVYDKKGFLIKVFEGGTPVINLAKVIKNSK
jgi:thioredoxin-related protein